MRSNQQGNPHPSGHQHRYPHQHRKGHLVKVSIHCECAVLASLAVVMRVETAF
jgi:hypothetical protein